jgi:hypothetical protein
VRDATRARLGFEQGERDRGHVGRCGGAMPHSTSTFQRSPLPSARGRRSSRKATALVTSFAHGENESIERAQRLEWKKPPERSGFFPSQDGGAGWIWQRPRAIRESMQGARRTGKWRRPDTSRAIRRL